MSLLLMVAGGVHAQPAPEPSATPAFLAAQDTQTWGAIETNTVSDLALATGIGIGITAITDAWNGMYVDQSIGMAGYSLAGGHLDRPYNEVIGIDLTADAPTWVLLRAAGTTEGGDSGNNTLGNFGDGQPRACHTYNHVCAGNGRVIHTGLDAHYSGTGFTTVAHYSAPLTQDASYTYHGNPLPTDGQNEGASKNWLGGGSAFDETTGFVWSTAQYGEGNRLVRFDPATDSFDLFNPPSTNVGYNWICIADELRLLIIGGVNGLWYASLATEVDEGTNTVTWHSVTRSGTPSITGQGQNAVYHHASRALFSHNGDGANIRKCTIPTTLNDTWVQSSVAPAQGNQVTPADPHANGTFGRFNIVRNLGGVDMFILHQSVTGPLYFMPIPEGGI